MRAALRRARDLGFLGEGPLEAQLEHSSGFADAAAAAGMADPPAAFLDLGSGGGVPGLVLAARWPRADVVLVDANERRCAALREAVESSGWQARARVVQARAEAAAREPELRGSFELVVARSFAAPAVTAECAAPFLRPGGLLVVSEPPLPEEPGADDAAGGAQDRATGHAGRWPSAGLEPLGLTPVRFVRARFSYQVLRQETLCPDRYPRREGVPAKRPLY